MTPERVFESLQSPRAHQMRLLELGLGIGLYPLLELSARHPLVVPEGLGGRLGLPGVPLELSRPDRLGALGHQEGEEAGVAGAVIAFEDGEPGFLVLTHALFKLWGQGQQLGPETLEGAHGRQAGRVDTRKLEDGHLEHFLAIPRLNGCQCRDGEHVALGGFYLLALASVWVLCRVC